MLVVGTWMLALEPGLSFSLLHPSRAANTFASRRPVGGRGGDGLVIYASKRKQSAAAKGFGKVTEPAPGGGASSSSVEASEAAARPSVAASSTTPILQSVDTASTTYSQSTTSTMAPEERTKQILRDQYGLRTMAEQQLDAKQLAIRTEDQKKWADLKRKAELNQDLDLFSIIPGPILQGIDLFLKSGLAVCSVLFVLSGLLITVEAWSKATENALPPDLDAFIVQTIEPNFTPGLLVLLCFSVSLGAFAALQLGSQGATYKERDS